MEGWVTSSLPSKIDWDWLKLNKICRYVRNYVILWWCYVYRNLLTPAGAALRSANFILRVYNAEDLPQSKSECSLNFALKYECVLRNEKFSYFVVLLNSEHFMENDYKRFGHVFQNQLNRY